MVLEGELLTRQGVHGSKQPLSPSTPLTPSLGAPPTPSEGEWERMGEKGGQVGGEGV